MHDIQKLLATLAVAGACGAASAAGSLVLDPAGSSVGPTDSFSLKVLGTGFTDVVVGGGFNLSFDPAILSLDSVAINTAVWEFAPITGTIDNVAGTLTDVSFATFVNSPTGNFEAATLNFKAKAPGFSPVTLAQSASFPFANAAAEQIEVSYGGANVNAVPEPATVVSLLLGLAVLPTMLRGART